MTGRLRLIAILGLASLGLAACDDDDSGGGDDDAALQGADTLGSGFTAAFAADANADPTDADDVTLTETRSVEPFDP